MTSRIGSTALSGLIVTLALAAASSVRARYGYQTGGINPYSSLGGQGVSSYSGGYNVGNGQLGAGYRSANRFQRQTLPTSRPLTTVNFQPLYNAITLLPGWSGSGSGSSYHVRRRLPRADSESSIPRAHLMDDDGTIHWPSVLPNDPSLAQARKAAEAAVHTVATESKTTGHASIRPVIDAKKTLTRIRRSGATAGQGQECRRRRLPRSLFPPDSQDSRHDGSHLLNSPLRASFQCSGLAR